MKYNNMIFNFKNVDKIGYIDIDGEIGESIDWEEMRYNMKNTNEGFKKQLNELGKVDKLIININSLGGSVYDGVSIHDLIKEYPAEVEVNIKGFTASAATIIAMAGDKINISSNAMFLIHRAWGVVIGNQNELKSQLDTLESIDKLLVNIYKNKTKNSITDIEKLMDLDNGNGKWLSAKKAKELGYVDEIIKPSSNVNNNLLKNFFMNSAIPKIDTEDLTDDELLNLLEDRIKGEKDFFNITDEELFDIVEDKLNKN